MHKSFANAAALGLQPSDPGGQGSLPGGALTAASHVMLLSQEHHDLAHAVQLDGRADRSISRQGLGFRLAAASLSGHGAWWPGVAGAPANCEGRPFYAHMCTRGIT